MDLKFPPYFADSIFDLERGDISWLAATLLSPSSAAASRSSSSSLRAGSAGSRAGTAYRTTAVPLTAGTEFSTAFKFLVKTDANSAFGVTDVSPSCYKTTAPV